MAAISARATIVRFAPRTAVLFEAAGLPVNLAGLGIQRVSAQIIPDGDRRVLIVRGDVTNGKMQSDSAPAMRVSVRDDFGQVLYSWTVRPPRQRIEPGESAAFLARLASPPAEGRTVSIEFELLNARAAAHRKVSTR